MIQRIKHETIGEHHQDHIILRDHFGKEMHLNIDPFRVEDDPAKPGGFKIISVDVEAEIQKAEALMGLRERAYAQHLKKHHPHHPGLKDFRPSEEGSTT